MVRSAVLGGGSLLLATAAHTAGGGQLPSPGLLLVVAVVLGPVAVLLTNRRCRLGVLVAVLAAQQGLLHGLFDLASVSHACTFDPAVTGHTAVGHGGMAHAAVVAPMCAGMPAMAGPGWLMWVAHLAATVLTAALLASGEAWLWRFVDRVAVAAGLRGRVRRPRRPVVGAAAQLPVFGGRRGWPAAAPRGPPPALVLG